MGLHAYRNIGFSFTESEHTCEGWRKKFTGFDPSRAAEVWGFPVEGDTITAECWGIHYRLNCSNGVLEKETEEGKWTEELFMNEALLIYHILGDVSPFPRRSDVWVSESSLDPVRVRSGDRMDPVLQAFSAHFSGKGELLRECCERLGGEPVKQGDRAWQFYPTPLTPVRLVFWEADEEFPAQASIYVKKYITDYMGFEAVGFLSAELLCRIEKEADTRIS